MATTYDDDIPTEDLLGIEEESFDAYEAEREAGAGRAAQRSADTVGEGWNEDESGHSWAQYFHDPVREPYGGAGGSGVMHPYGGRRFAYGRESSAAKGPGELYGYDVRGFGHRRDSFYATAGATPWWEGETGADLDAAEAERGRFAGIGPRGYKRPDVRVEEEVVQRLEDAEWIDATDVEVEVADGVVTLAGEVETRAERRAAEDLAAEVAGVVDVINRLRSRQRRRGAQS
ncbi:MAG TPA: BON domain-containing protein [Thermoanaerobaculia bacterium]|nr:BON domain-containing protein [Thermoanaerobaculia bacterium]